MGAFWSSKDPVEPEHEKAPDGQSDGSAGTTPAEQFDFHDHDEPDEGDKS